MQLALRVALTRLRLHVLAAAAVVHASGLRIAAAGGRTGLRLSVGREAPEVRVLEAPGARDHRGLKGLGAGGPLVPGHGALGVGMVADLQRGDLATRAVVRLQAAVDAGVQVGLSKGADHAPQRELSLELQGTSWQRIKAQSSHMLDPAQDLQSTHHLGCLLSFLPLRELLRLTISMPLSVVAARIAAAGRVVRENITRSVLEGLLKLSAIALLTAPLHLLRITEFRLHVRLILRLDHQVPRGSPVAQKATEVVLEVL